jgi:hypothetical protein
MLGKLLETRYDKTIKKIRMWVCVGSSRRIRHGFTPD